MTIFYISRTLAALRAQSHSSSIATWQNGHDFNQVVKSLLAAITPRCSGKSCVSQDIPNIDLRDLQNEKFCCDLLILHLLHPRCKGLTKARPLVSLFLPMAVFHPGPRCNGFWMLMPYASAFRNGTWRFAGHYFLTLTWILNYQILSLDLFPQKRVYNCNLETMPGH